MSKIILARKDVSIIPEMNMQINHYRIITLWHVVKGQSTATSPPWSVQERIPGVGVS